MKTINKEKLAELKDTLKTKTSQMMSIYEEHEELASSLNDAITQMDDIIAESEIGKNEYLEALKELEDFEKENNITKKDSGDLLELETAEKVSTEEMINAHEIYNELIESLSSAGKELENAKDDNLIALKAVEDFKAENIYFLGLSTDNI